MSSQASQLFFNPACSKCRSALEVLRSRGHEPEVVKYLQTKPAKKDLQQILQELGKRPRDILRTGEAAYKDNGLADTSLSDDELLQAMVDHPILMERPIFRLNGKAVVGRPPENVLQLL